jgi:hypothetical protein
VATTPRGDQEELRRLAVRGLARKVVGARGVRTPAIRPRNLRKPGTNLGRNLGPSRAGTSLGPSRGTGDRWRISPPPTSSPPKPSGTALGPSRPGGDRISIGKPPPVTSPPKPSGTALGPSTGGGDRWQITDPVMPNGKKGRRY